MRAGREKQFDIDDDFKDGANYSNFSIICGNGAEVPIRVGWEDILDLKDLIEVLELHRKNDKVIKDARRILDLGRET